MSKRLGRVIISTKKAPAAIGPYNQAVQVIIVYVSGKVFVKDLLGFERLAGPKLLVLTTRSIRYSPVFHRFLLFDYTTFALMSWKCLMISLYLFLGQGTTLTISVTCKAYQKCKPLFNVSSMMRCWPDSSPTAINIDANAVGILVCFTYLKTLKMVPTVAMSDARHK